MCLDWGLDCMPIVKALVVTKEHWLALDLKYRLLRLGYEVFVSIRDTFDEVQCAIDNFHPDLILLQEEAIIDSISTELPILCLDANATRLPCLANPHDDVSLSTAIRETLHQQRIKLQNRQQVELLYTVDHELRTPLSTMLITLDWLELIEQEHLSARSLQRLEHVGLARNSVSQMAELLDRASLLCRANSKRLTWKPTTIDLRKFCTRLVNEVQNSSIELIFIDINGLIEFDEMILRHVLLNLLNNAVKYSNSTVYLTLELTNTELTTRVQDYGIGITERDRALIFTPLYRGSNSTTIPGTGMGLAIVQQLVSTCHGTIMVESVLNQGSTFTVTLPLGSPT
jgi:signal transduction histidine kinase